MKHNINEIKKLYEDLDKLIANLPERTFDKLSSATIELGKAIDDSEKELRELQRIFRKEIYGDETYEGTTAITIEEILGEGDS